MALTTAARAARKATQLARIGAKLTPDYAQRYASQPGQVERAAAAERRREDYRNTKSMLSRAVLSTADADAAAFGSIVAKVTK